jgi:putative hydrolase of the HAD superfamily
MTEATPADTLAALPGVARPRGLLLDFGSVISVSIFERHRETERILGLPAGRLDWLGALDPATDPLWQAMQRDEITERDYWATRARQTGEAVGEPGWDMRTMLSRIRQQDPAAVVRPAMAELVEAAHAQGVRLGILTNELELFHGRASMDRMPVLARFPVLVDATHTGILKPDPAAYALAVDAMGLAPQEILFVDDQFRNIAGAVRAGLQVQYFDLRDVPGQLLAIAARLGLAMRPTDGAAR